MTDTIRRISWRDLFPWLILLRTFRIAISPSILALATVAVLIAPVGWRIAALVFQPEFLKQPKVEIPANAPESLRRLMEEQQARIQQRALPRSENSLLAQWTPHAVQEYLPSARTAILDAYFELADPLARLFQMQLGVRGTAYYAFGFLWTLLIWSFPGAFITRRAVVQLASESPPGIRELSTFAGRRWIWYFLAPLYPLIPIVGIALCIAILGLPIRFAPGIGSVLAGLAWIIVVVVSLGVLWLIAGLMFGFPLMWPTISAERDGDAFEAFSRSFSYVYGKPLNYFFYVVVAALFGALCWAVVAGAGTIVQEFGFWALAWGGTGEKVAPIRQAALNFAAGGPAAKGDIALTVGTTLLGLFVWLIQSTVVAFRYSFFFAAASAIYLLLRHDVDEKEMDEVFLDEPARPVVTPVSPELPGPTATPAPAADPPTAPSE
jgi:hypothetical protein